MATSSQSRPPVKGVEFSDQLIVLGPSPPFTTPKTYSQALPKAQVFVHRGQLATKHMQNDVHADHPHKPRSVSAHFEHTVVEEDDSTSFDMSPSLPFRNQPNRHARCFEKAPQLISHSSIPTPSRPDDEPVETSCTDSEEDHEPYPNQVNHNYTPQLQQSVERCTRINTKLNSLPSGGAFSFMNSSEDVDLSSSDDEQLTASRKLIRVHGSAKLSSASGLGEDLLEIDEDEFVIEGAERVEEEEAVNVRSFGRSFARVCLKDDLDDFETQNPTTWEKRESQVPVDVTATKIAAERNPTRSEDGVASGSASAVSARSAPKKKGQQVFPESRSVPPLRKSRLRLTFVRRASVAEEAECERNAKAGSASKAADDSVSGVVRLSCFPTRKWPTKQVNKGCHISGGGTVCGTKNSKDSGGGKRPGEANGTKQMVAVPEFDILNGKGNRTRKSRKMVKNISMQRDDWIDFATNSPHRQRSQWFARLISPSGGDSEVSSRRDSRGADSEVSRRSRNSGWRLWKFWSRK